MVAPPTEFDFGVLRQQNVLAFYVAVDDVVGVQVGQTLEEEGERGMRVEQWTGEEEGEEEEPHPEDLPGDVGDPVFLQLVPFGVLHQVRDGAGTTELHHQLGKWKKGNKQVSKSVSKNQWTSDGPLEASRLTQSWSSCPGGLFLMNAP